MHSMTQPLCKKTFNIGLHSDAYESICFKLGLMTYTVKFNPVSGYRSSADGPQNVLSSLWATQWRLASFLNLPSLLFQAMDTERT